MSLPNELRRFIPSVNTLLSTPPIVEALRDCPRWAIVQETRAVVDEIREGEIPVVSEKAKLDSWHQELGKYDVGDLDDEPSSHQIDRADANHFAPP